MRWFLAGCCTILAANITLADDRQDEMKKMGGTWMMLSGEMDGGALPPMMLKSSTREIRDDITTVKLGGKLFMKAKFTLDPGKDPKTIDYEILEGPEKGMTRLGIYALTGDRVKFCYAMPGQPRPVAFKTTAGSGLTLSEWKRKR